jgi:hypothetical protein
MLNAIREREVTSLRSTVLPDAGSRKQVASSISAFMLNAIREREVTSFRSTFYRVQVSGNKLQIVFSLGGFHANGPFINER